MKKLDLKLKKLVVALDLLMKDEHLLRQLGALRDECNASVGAQKFIVAGGNGGSASQAEHFTAELTGRYLLDRPGIPAMNLNSNLAELTSVSNDYGYKNSFSRNIQTFDKYIGTIILLTTSGNSKNITKVFFEKNRKKCWMLTSQKYEFEDERCLKVPSVDTPIIQEMHLAILHWLAEEIESEFVGNQE